MPKGSCLCGYVKYEYDQAAMKAICHCLTCRKITGSCFATTVLVPELAWHLLEPQPDALKVTETPHESGMTIYYSSCPQCSNTLFKTATGFPGAVVVFVGNLDKKTSLPNGHAAGEVNGDGKVDAEDIETEGAPQMELWTKYRVPWLSPLGNGVKEFEGFPPHA